MSAEERLLIESAAGAWRERGARGELRPHPAWADLDERGRAQAYALGAELRALEAALDPEGLSSTARAVLARIRAAGADPR